VCSASGEENVTLCHLGEDGLPICWLDILSLKHASEIEKLQSYCFGSKECLGCYIGDVHSAKLNTVSAPGSVTVYLKGKSNGILCGTCTLRL